MKIQSLRLLEDLQADTRQIILEANYFLKEDPALLIQMPAPGKWSAAQAIEHLNTYGRYYLPAIGQAIAKHTYPPSTVFTPGWLGGMFTKTMRPGSNNKISFKMKTFRQHRPPADVDSKPVIDEFLQQEQQLLALLEKAKHANIDRIRIPITLTSLVKLKLGDVFRFMVAHHQRHFIQAGNALRLVKQADTSHAALT